MTASSGCSIIVPAHDEEAVIGRLLDELAAAEPGALEIVVVCNGCQDATASVARRHHARPRVVELAEASKHAALVAGDRAAHRFPRLYVDADVVISASDALALAAAVTTAGGRVAAPRRRLDARASSAAVRRYHRLWEALPAASGGVYGRGVIAVNESGWQRLRDRPEVLADDAYVDAAFEQREKLLVTDACSTVHLPCTVRDLVRRRIRVVHANTLLREASCAPALPRTRIRDIAVAVARDPRLATSVPTFVAVTVMVRLGAARRRRSHDTRWLSDDSRAPLEDRASQQPSVAESPVLRSS